MNVRECNILSCDTIAVVLMPQHSPLILIKFGIRIQLKESVVGNFN